MEEKNKEINELKDKLKKSQTPKKTKKDKSISKDSSPAKSDKQSRPKSTEKDQIKLDLDESKDDDLNRRDNRFDDSYERPSKEVIVQKGIDTHEVVKLIKTVVESTQKGIPLETTALGATGAESQILPKELIEDLIKHQQDKVNFVGSQGGTTILNSKELNRRDKINLIKLDEGKDSLEKELSDPSKACEMVIRFDSFITLDDNDQCKRIPDSVFMTYKFFTFPETNTTPCNLVIEDEKSEFKEADSDDERVQKRSIKPNKQYKLMRETPDNTEMNYDDRTTCRAEFKVDPSTSRIRNENLTLITYLRERVLSVDIFDSYSQLHIGVAKVPLFNLLRQGKELHSQGLECDV